MANPKDIVDIPLASGLATKEDSRAMEAPGLSVCEDVQFDEIGGIQTRPQFQAITDSASNTIADIRKIEAYGDELIAFSKDKLWSYSSGDGLWTQRAEHLAVKVEENSRFVTTGDQFDCDRAELGGITMYCWSETTPSETTSYVAAIDTVSGSVKLAPTEIKSGTTKPRLLVSTNRIFLVSIHLAGADLWVRAYDPSDLSSTETSTGLSSLVSFDAIVDPVTPTEIIVAVSRAGSGYTIANYTETPAVSGQLSKAASSADDAISVASNTSTQRVAVTFTSGTAVKTDILDADFADVSMGVATGTAANSNVSHVASTWDATNSYFVVFWTALEGSGGSTSGNFYVETNSVTAAGTPGTESTILWRCGIASQPFVHDGNVFLWTVFAGVSQGDLVAQLQNTYFLIRADGLVVAKAAHNSASGFITKGQLASVQDLGSNKFALCGGIRRIIPLGQGQKGYAARSPQDLVIEFDTNDARRTVKLGETLYVASGLLQQYDGVNLTEVGFNQFPWYIQPTSGAAGLLTGTYNYKMSWSWHNAKGEFERSSTATVESVTLTSEKGGITSTPLHVTAKTGSAGEAASEYWRQIDAAPVGAPYYLVTSKDPAATGDNAYIENAPMAAVDVSFDDNLVDADLVKREPFPENGGLTLASVSPPPACIIAGTQDRIMLAGIPGKPHTVAYSRIRAAGEVASFNEFLSVDLPPTGGKITAIDFLNETMIVFKESAIYALGGDGFDNNGGGQNYGPARLLDSDVGAISAEGVVLTPKGLLFKSSKGWFLLNHGWQAGYVGGPVDEYDSDTIVSCEAMESQHQVRCVSTTRTLVWDYLVNQWGVWTTSAVDAVVWGGVHHLVNSAADGVLAQASTYSGSGDLPGLDIETGWIKLGQLQGFKLIRKILVLGEYLDEHDLRIRVAYNYAETASGPTWVDDKVWAPVTVVALPRAAEDDQARVAEDDDPRIAEGGANTSILAANEPLQMVHGPSRPKCESIKIRITAQAPEATSHPITQALNLTGLSLEVALRKGAYGGLAVAYKQ